MLTVGKPPEFGPDRMVISGQYHPDIPGWRLRWFEKGQETLLFTGTLASCRRLMDACRGLAGLEDVRRLVASREQGETAELQPSPATGMSTEVFPPCGVDQGEPDANPPPPPRKRRGGKKKQG